MKNYLFFTCAIFFSSLMRSQDTHFSQYNENPSLLNPAMTGVDGMRASINARTQWNSVTMPFKTTGASIEARNSTVKKKAGTNLDNTPATERVPGKFAAGLSIYKDKAGDGGMILNQLNLSLATFLKTGEKSAISFGVQASLATRKVNSPNFIYPNQYNGSVYDPDLNSGENFASEKFRYVDLASGVLFSYSDEERGLKDHKEVKGRIGFAAYHLTSPQQKYLAKKTDGLYTKFVSHGDLLKSIPNTRTAIQGSYLFQLQANAIEVVVGAQFRYHMKNDTRYTGYIKRSTVAAGLYYRTSDAIIFSGYYEWQEQVAFGLSYDFNVSKLVKATNIRGALEITIRYTSGHSFLYQKVK